VEVADGTKLGLTGDLEGTKVGLDDLLGLEVGAATGDEEGIALGVVGKVEGVRVKTKLGLVVNAAGDNGVMVGDTNPTVEGFALGDTVLEGLRLGCNEAVGIIVGKKLGMVVGISVGNMVGDSVGK